MAKDAEHSKYLWLAICISSFEKWGDVFLESDISNLKIKNEKGFVNIKHKKSWVTILIDKIGSTNKM